MKAKGTKNYKKVLGEYPDDMVATVRFLYGQGMTCNAVAEVMNISRITLRRLMRLHGIVVFGRRQKLSGRKRINFGYAQCHAYVKRVRGRPTECSGCGKTGGAIRQYHWANLSGNFNDPHDYIRLCATCHLNFDNSRRGHTPRERQDIPRAEVMKDIASGMNIYQVSKKYGCAHATISRIVRIMEKS